MGLRDRTNEPSNRLEDYTIFLSGAKKVGKTSLAAQFTKSFIFEFEVGNAKHLRCAYHDIESLKTLDQVLSEAEKETIPGTWVFDEVGILYDYIVEDICKKEGVLGLDELGFGKGWSRAKRTFRAYFTKFQSLKGGKIYTGHEEEKSSNSKSNRSIARSEARLSKEANRVMEEYTHMWLVMNFDSKGGRYLQIKGDDYIKAGHGFEDRFNLVQDGKIPLGNSAKEAYQNFVKAWNNEPIVSNVSVPTKRVSFSIPKG